MVVISKEMLTDFKEVYEKSINLVNEGSKNDPATDPYRSHYAARELLLEMKDNLKNTILSQPADADYLIYKVLLAFAYRDLGRIYIFTEEVAIGETYLQECLELMEPYKMQSEAIIPYVGALNEMGIVHANREEYQKSFDVLTKSEAAYKSFKDSELRPMAIIDVFDKYDETLEFKGPAELESLYTLCTFYLAQVYGHLGELEKSAIYCHMTLQRQLRAKSYEPVDFALNAATLSQYYIGQSMFPQARHHLAAATMIMDEHEKTMIQAEMTDQEATDLKETYKHRYADVARCWAKYGLGLLLASKERLYNDDEEKLTADAKRLTIDPNSCRFPDIDLTKYEKRIDADYCLTFDDAKPVYHFVINWLDVAKEYYKPDTDATEYAKIIKDFAELYQHIAFFEEDPINQGKMQKRRAKYYEELLELLNPLFYMTICRECWYGAGLAYCAILDIKLDSMRGGALGSPQELNKINQVCQNASKNFVEFAKSYTDKDGETLKANLDIDEQRTVLYAYFYLGRLHYKMMTADHAVQLVNMNNSLRYYKLFTDQCAERKEAAEALKAEIGVCAEMVKLLPLKIANLQKRLNK